MIKKVIILLMVVGWTSTAISQESHGYIGKKWNIYAGTNLAQTFESPNKNLQKGVFKYDYLYHGGIDYSAKKNISVGVEMEYIQTLYPAFSNYNDPAYHIPMDVFAYSGYIKFYTRYDAPLGFWMKVQPKMVRYEAEYRPGASFEESFKSSLYGAQFGLGRTYVFLDYLTISPCLSFGLLIGKGEFPLIDVSIYEESPITHADRKVREMGLINIGVSIGFIAF